MKNLLSSLLLLAVLFYFAPSTYGYGSIQYPSTTFRVIIDSFPNSALTSTYFANATNNTNETVINAGKRVVFSVWLKNTSVDGFEFSGGQVFFNFNKNVLNSGTGILNLVASSLPGTAPSTGMWLKNPTVYTTSTPGQLRTAANTPQGVGSGYILNAGDSILWGRFKLTTSVAIIGNVTFDLTTRLQAAGNPYIKYGHYYNTVNTEIHNYGVYTNAPNTEPLPVELVNFSATSDKRDMRLKWETATEVNSSRYEIERSLVKVNVAQRDWVKVGSVAAAGNSNSKKEYSFTDKKLNTGTYAYRLKMIDNDGSFDYSKEIQGSVDKPTSFDLSQNYPNPFNPSTRIDYQLPADANVTLELYTISGERIASLINEQQTAGYYTFNISANEIRSGLASGMYIYRLAATGKTADQKFVSVKKMILMK